MALALAPHGTRAETPDALVREALAAEARLETRRALDLLLRAEAAGRTDAFVLQRIARHYSDLTLDLPDRDAQRRSAEQALEYSRRATALAPRDPINVLSIAISYGKLAIASGPGDKVRYSRQVREYAEQALALDPAYAWAHHILGRWHREVAALGAASRAAVSLLFGGLPRGSLRDAVQHLEHAVRLEPDELQHHLELGAALHATGEHARARAALERGLSLPDRARIDAAAKERARLLLENLPR